MLGIARKHINKKRKHPVLDEIFKTTMVMVGAVLVAVGLEMFLVPNDFLDGGIVGISIIASSFFPSVPLGVFIAVINIPFLVLAYLHAGLRSAIRTAIGIATLSIMTITLHHSHPLTDEFFVALAAGGALLGVGVGMALRYGGALDGTETLAVTISNKTSLGVDQIILMINFLIFTVAWFVFTPDRAIASFLLFYVVVAPLITKVMEGGSETKRAEITTVNKDAVLDMLRVKFNRRVFITEGALDGVDGPAWKLQTYVIRSQESALTELVEEVDEEASVAFFDVASVHGASFKKDNHH